MDSKDLANLIFPDAKDYTYYEEKYVARSYQRVQLLQDLLQVQQDLFI